MSNPPNRTIIGWAAIYDSGEIYRSDLVSWAMIPKRGLQVLNKWWREVGEDVIYEELAHGCDAYCVDDTIMANDLDCVKFGRWISDEDFSAIRKQFKAFLDSLENPITEIV